MKSKNWKFQTYESAPELETGSTALFLSNRQPGRVMQPFNINSAQVKAGKIFANQEDVVCAINKRCVRDFPLPLEIGLKTKKGDKYSQKARAIGGPGKIVLNNALIYRVEPEIKEVEEQNTSRRDKQTTTMEDILAEERMGGQKMRIRYKPQGIEDTIIKVKYCPKEASKGFWDDSPSNSGRETEVVKRIKGEATVTEWVPYIIEDLEERIDDNTGLEEVDISFENPENIFAILVPGKYENGAMQEVSGKSKRYNLSMDPEVI